LAFSDKQGFAKTNAQAPPKKGEEQMTKKRSLLLVSLFLVFGLATMATSAFAQASFGQSTGQNLSIRNEGLAEAVGAITLTTTSLGTITSYSGFIITYPLPVTDVGTVDISCSGTAAAALCGGLPVGSLSSANLTGGNKILRIPFTSNFNLSTNTSPGSAVTVVVRVNATGASPGPIYATVSYFNGTAPVSYYITVQSAGTQQWIGTVQPEPAFSLGFGYYWQQLSQAADVVICLGVIKDNDEFQNHFVLNVDENFIYAMTSESYEYILDPGEPGAGELTNGSNISVTIWNIPKGLGLKAEHPHACVSLTGTPLYCPGGSLAVSNTGTTWFEGDGVTTSFTFEYEVTSVDTGYFAESVDLPFKITTFKKPLGVENLAQVYATVQKDPNPWDDPGCFIYNNSGAVTGLHCWPAFIYKFEGTQGVYGISVVEFTNCITNLLWPFITVNGLWDSAVAVSNTTTDQLANNTSLPSLVSGSALPENGSCDMSFYAGGSLVLEWSTGNIPTATVYGVDMASIVRGAVPGFNGNGYVFGTCYFSNAKGYAYIVNNYGSSSSMFSNYLAEIIPDPQWVPRSLNGWGIGEGAVSPLNINQHLLYQLMIGFGHHH
jgi:hypothetical protein